MDIWSFCEPANPHHLSADTLDAESVDERVDSGVQVRHAYRGCMYNLEEPMAEDIYIFGVADDVHDDLHGGPADDVATEYDAEGLSDCYVRFDELVPSGFDIFPLLENISRLKVK